jgi:hypothetical protein
MAMRDALEASALDPNYTDAPGMQSMAYESEVGYSKAISLKRIADALERISECADGVHPSAFRIIKQG